MEKQSTTTDQNNNSTDIHFHSPLLPLSTVTENKTTTISSSVKNITAGIEAGATTSYSASFMASAPPQVVPRSTSTTQNQQQSSSQQQKNQQHQTSTASTTVKKGVHFTQEQQQQQSLRQPESPNTVVTSSTTHTSSSQQQHQNLKSSSQPQQSITQMHATGNASVNFQVSKPGVANYHQTQQQQRHRPHQNPITTTTAICYRELLDARDRGTGVMSLTANHLRLVTKGLVGTQISTRSFVQQQKQIEKMVILNSKNGLLQLNHNNDNASAFEGAGGASSSTGFNIFLHPIASTSRRSTLLVSNGKIGATNDVFTAAPQQQQEQDGEHNKALDFPSVSASTVTNTNTNTTSDGKTENQELRKQQQLYANRPQNLRLNIPTNASQNPFSNNNNNNIITQPNPTQLVPSSPQSTTHHVNNINHHSVAGPFPHSHEFSKYTNTTAANTTTHGFSNLLTTPFSATTTAQHNGHNRTSTLYTAISSPTFVAVNPSELNNPDNNNANNNILGNDFLNSQPQQRRISNVSTTISDQRSPPMDRLGTVQGFVSSDNTAGEARAAVVVVASVIGGEADSLSSKHHNNHNNTNTQQYQTGSLSSPASPFEHAVPPKTPLLAIISNQHQIPSNTEQNNNKNHSNVTGNNEQPSEDMSSASLSRQQPKPRSIKERHVEQQLSIIRAALEHYDRDEDAESFVAVAAAAAAVKSNNKNESRTAQGNEGSQQQQQQHDATANTSPDNNSNLNNYGATASSSMMASAPSSKMTSLAHQQQQQSTKQQKPLSAIVRATLEKDDVLAPTGIYRKLKFLGEGSFGTTWLVEWKRHDPDQKEQTPPGNVSLMSSTKIRVVIDESKSVHVRKVFVMKTMPYDGSSKKKEKEKQERQNNNTNQNEDDVDDDHQHHHHNNKKKKEKTRKTKDPVRAQQQLILDDCGRKIYDHEKLRKQKEETGEEKQNREKQQTAHQIDQTAEDDTADNTTNNKKKQRLKKVSTIEEVDDHNVMDASYRSDKKSGEATTTTDASGASEEVKSGEAVLLGAFSISPPTDLQLQHLAEAKEKAQFQNQPQQALITATTTTTTTSPSNPLRRVGSRTSMVKKSFNKSGNICGEAADEDVIFHNRNVGQDNNNNNTSQQKNEGFVLSNSQNADDLANPISRRHTPENNNINNLNHHNSNHHQNRKTTATATTTNTSSSTTTRESAKHMLLAGGMFNVYKKESISNGNNNNNNNPLKKTSFSNPSGLLLHGNPLHQFSNTAAPVMFNLSDQIPPLPPKFPTTTTGSPLQTKERAAAVAAVTNIYTPIAGEGEDDNNQNNSKNKSANQSTTETTITTTTTRTSKRALFGSQQGPLSVNNIHSLLNAQGGNGTSLGSIDHPIQNANTNNNNFNALKKPNAKAENNGINNTQTTPTGSTNSARNQSGILIVAKSGVIPVLPSAASGIVGGLGSGRIGAPNHQFVPNYSIDLNNNNNNACSGPAPSPSSFNNNAATAAATTTPSPQKQNTKHVGMTSSPSNNNKNSSSVNDSSSQQTGGGGGVTPLPPLFAPYSGAAAAVSNAINPLSPLMGMKSSFRTPGFNRVEPQRLPMSSTREDLDASGGDRMFRESSRARLRRERRDKRLNTFEGGDQESSSLTESQTIPQMEGAHNNNTTLTKRPSAKLSHNKRRVGDENDDGGNVFVSNIPVFVGSAMRAVLTPQPKSAGSAILMNGRRAGLNNDVDDIIISPEQSPSKTPNPVANRKPHGLPPLATISENNNEKNAATTNNENVPVTKKKNTSPTTILNGGGGASSAANQNNNGRPLLVPPPHNVGAKDAENFVLSNCAHPNIVGYVDSFVANNELHLVMEYVDGRTLAEEIAEREAITHRPFSSVAIRQRFVQIVLALEYLHRHQMLHRDLKPSNILVSGRKTVKLADFGFAKQLDNLAFSVTCLGTVAYMAPEQLLNKPYTSKADMWSAGVVLYEMLCLEVPFAGAKDAEELAQMIQNHQFAGVAHPVPNGASNHNTLNQNNNNTIKNTLTGTRSVGGGGTFMMSATMNADTIQNDIPPTSIVRPEQIDREMMVIAKRLMRVNPDDRLSAKQVLELPVMQEALREYVDKFIEVSQHSPSDLDRSWAAVLQDHVALLMRHKGSSITSAESKHLHTNKIRTRLHKRYLYSAKLCLMKMKGLAGGGSVGVGVQQQQKQQDKQTTTHVEGKNDDDKKEQQQVTNDTPKQPNYEFSALVAGTTGSAGLTKSSDNTNSRTLQFNTANNNVIVNLAVANPNGTNSNVNQPFLLHREISNNRLLTASMELRRKRREELLARSDVGLDDKNNGDDDEMDDDAMGFESVKKKNNKSPKNKKKQGLPSSSDTDDYRE